MKVILKICKKCNQEKTKINCCFKMFENICEYGIPHKKAEKSRKNFDEIQKNSL